MRIKINLDTDSAAVRLVDIATRLNDNITLTDGKGSRVSAKSLLGSAYAKFEFTEIWLESEHDHYIEFRDFIVEE